MLLRQSFTDGLKIIHLSETSSTNDFLRTYDGELGRKMTVVTADYQYAGRGQGGNHWSSEAGKNLLFSILTFPKSVPISRQFVMLEAKALAVKRTLDDYLGNTPYRITIKWPNDIYYGDSKICGTISECLIGNDKIKSCILGTGLNVNQKSFPLDIPNPISMYNILGKETDRNSLLCNLLENFETYIDVVYSGSLDGIHDAYCSSLYRRNGIYLFKDAMGSFSATIDHVEPSGHIVLRCLSGKLCQYAFKEVYFVK